MIIDADTHAHECADTWSYFPKGMEDLKPVPMNFEPNGKPGYMADRGREEHATFIDGQVYARHIPDDESSGTSAPTRELRDFAARIRDMDNLGVDVQVIYPTVLLPEVTRRPELDIALCESYNRWLADRCADSGGRLRWCAVLPLRSIPDALAELRRAKEAGAVAIFKRGYECDERHASDPYFAPMYSLAQELDLPVCFHVGRPYTGNATSLTKTQAILPNDFYVQDAFLSIVRDGMVDAFPTLRLGFIEASAGWVPHTAWMAGFLPNKGSDFDDPVLRNNRNDGESGRTREALEEFLSESRIYVTCEVSENTKELIDRFGDSALMVGSDYSHNDRSAVIDIHRVIAERPGLSKESVQKINGDNAARFYKIA